MPRPTEYKKLPHENRKAVFPGHWGVKQVPILGWSQRTGRSQVMATHAHPDCFEIHFVKKGKFQYWVEGKPYAVKGGQAVITAPREVQGSNDQPLDRCEFYWLQFTLKPEEPFFSFPPSSIQDLHRFLVKQTKGSRVFPVSKDYFDLLGWLISWKPEQQTFPEGAPEARLAMLMRFCVEGLGKGSNVHLSPLIRKSMEHMERHLKASPDKAISVEQISDGLGLSRNHFQERFRKETGYSPADYFLRLKIEAIQKEMVEKKGAGVLTELALRYFASSQVFSKVFRRVTGTSPREWRKSLS